MRYTSWISRSRWITPLAFIVVAIVLSRCGKNNPAAPASGTFTDIYTNTIKSANCAQCHSPTGAAKVDHGVVLDFTTQALAYQTLTTSKVTGSTSVGICPNVKIVTASDATKSYLAAVLFTDYNKNNFAGVSGCTPYTVHLQDQNISAAEKTSIIAWITNGAANN